MQPSRIGTTGTRVSPLSFRDLKKDEDGLKVRCNIEYQSDTDNNFFGAPVTSGEMVLRTAHITSFAASDVGPINGKSITLTCIAMNMGDDNFLTFYMQGPSLKT